MQGELIRVWPATWREIWSKLPKNPMAPADLYCQLYSELVGALVAQPDSQTLADIVNDPGRAKEAFKKIKIRDFDGERALVIFLEQAQTVLYEQGGDQLANHYFNLLTNFIEKYNLRYDIRRPCILCPTLPGVFSSLMNDLRIVTRRDAHLDTLMKEFENSIRDLRIDRTDNRIKTCIQKQVNLLEAIGRTCPGVTHTTLGSICDQVNTWPHQKVKEAMQNVYRFASDYPGIRHGGTPASAIRTIEMRDMVAISVLLTGFVHYLTDQLDAEDEYQGN